MSLLLDLFKIDFLIHTFNSKNLKTSNLILCGIVVVFWCNHYIDNIIDSSMDNCVMIIIEQT